MLNRTIRTLSANSNRLVLGTRSLALVAGVNNGTTLRFRPAHAPSLAGALARAEAMRFGPSILMPAYPPAKPGDKRGHEETAGPRPSFAPTQSSSSPSWCPPSWRSMTDGRAQVRVVAEAPPVLRQVVVLDAPSGRSVPEQPGQPQPQAPSRQAASTRASRSAVLASRSARSTPLASAAAS